MRAMVFDRYGEPDVLRLWDVPVPHPQDGEVSIWVGFVGVNPAEAAFFPPGEIEVAALAAGGFSIYKNEPRVRLAILPNHWNKLPAAVESAILYEVHLFMPIPTVPVRRAPSVFEKADTRGFMKMDSDPVTRCK